MNINYEQYAFIFKALSDETRLKILLMLSSKELCACKILDEFNITQPTLSYHMKMLVDADLVIARKDGSWVKYSLNDIKKKEILMFISYIMQEDYSSTGGSVK